MLDTDRKVERFSSSLKWRQEVVKAEEGTPKVSERRLSNLNRHKMAFECRQDPGP